MILRNVMEDVVNNLIDHLAVNRELLGVDSGACFCSHCRMDMAALSLNHLPPKYVVSKRGEALAKAERMQTQLDVDALGIVVAAIRTVKEDPRHCLFQQRS